ncbi:MAG: hypothetical protein AB1646_14005 [Thermodesulfobacteriota bacterium]
MKWFGTPARVFFPIAVSLATAVCVPAAGLGDQGRDQGRPVQTSFAALCPEARVMPSPVLSPSLKHYIESDVKSVCEYLARVGVKPDPRPIEISFNPRLIDTAYYAGTGHRIVVATSLAVDIEVILRQYVHVALHSAVSDEARSVYVSLFPSIHSGLVNYFLASFHGYPVSRGIACKNTLDVAFIRRLDNDLAYEQLPYRVVWPEKRDILAQVWGGLFWDIRKALGQEKADKMLLAALRSLRASDFRADSAGRYPKRLLDAARLVDGGRHVAAIEKIMQRRNIQASGPDE